MKKSRMAFLMAGIPGGGGGPATLFFPSRCGEASRLQEGVGDHRHQGMSTTCLQNGRAPALPSIADAPVHKSTVP